MIVKQGNYMSSFRLSEMTIDPEGTFISSQIISCKNHTSFNVQIHIASTLCSYEAQNYYGYYTVNVFHHGSERGIRVIVK